MQNQPNKSFAMLTLLVIILLVLCGLGMVSFALPVFNNIVPLPN